MVNEKQGKVYSPNPVYNRKLVRSVLKNSIEKKYGQHNVSKLVHEYFEKYQGTIHKKLKEA